MCSQSTISRLENLPDARTLLRLGRALVDLYCTSFRQVPRRIVLDLDDTSSTRSRRPATAAVQCPLRRLRFSADRRLRPGWSTSSPPSCARRNDRKASRSGLFSAAWSARSAPTNRTSPPTGPRVPRPPPTSSACSCTPAPTGCCGACARRCPGPRPGGSPSSTRSGCASSSIAARVVEMKTKIKIYLPTSAPDQSIFRLVLGRLPRLVDLTAGAAAPPSHPIPPTSNPFSPALPRTPPTAAGTGSPSQPRDEQFRHIRKHSLHSGELTGLALMMGKRRAADMRSKDVIGSAFAVLLLADRDRRAGERRQSDQSGVRNGRQRSSPLRGEDSRAG